MFGMMVYNWIDSSGQTYFTKPSMMFCYYACVCVCEQLKQMEVQLEEEYEEKQKVLRERRDLEAKLMSAQDQVQHFDDRFCIWKVFIYILIYVP